MHFDFISVVPDVFDSYMQSSVIGNAVKSKLITYATHNLHDYTHDSYRKVDDKPFGGGPGQLMMCEPIFEAVEDLKNDESKVILFSASGVPFNQDYATELKQNQHLIFICGRFEGVDERVTTICDFNISIGDYVLTGGELPAMVVADAVARLIPGVLGSHLSASDESFSDGLLEYPQYTRPANFRGLKVPEILLSGDHKKIAEYRHEMSIRKTLQIRPDLFKN